MSENTPEPFPLLRRQFEEGLRSRAPRVRFQHIIPAHWFADAASECFQMYVAGCFYGAISLAQAYVEALGKFLADCRRVPGARNSPDELWSKLLKERIVGESVSEAAKAIYRTRDHFPHLNRQVETDRGNLEALALDCINNLYLIESEVFSYRFENGKTALGRPEYWRDAADDPNSTVVRLRNL
jgi:hypothetical protein